jgi:two-component system chemotaxis sensor kinase CheA
MIIDAHRQAFIEEASELLSELELSLLEVEKCPDNNDLIAKIFRALHTIKGSSGMFGYDEISMFTHDIENVYDKIRNGSIAITKSIIDLTLQARDQISQMLSKTNDSDKIDEEITKSLLTSFRSIVNEHSQKESTTNKLKETDLKIKSDAEVKTYFLKFSPNPAIFMSGSNPLRLINEIKDLGSAIILGKYDSIPLLENFNSEKCYFSWEIILRTKKEIDSIKDVFIFVEDDSEINITIIDEKGKLRRDEDFYDFEKLLLDIAKTKYPDILGLLSEYETSSMPAVFDRASNAKQGREVLEHHFEADAASSIRVSAEKLDELVNLVGELVTTQARLSQIAQNSKDVNIAFISEEVERLTWSLRDSALNIRMLPIGTTFSKFKRLVRDLSKDLGKEVELTTEGAETELDKTVIEKLNDPLIHIIRNSIDHGVELPEERIAAGKPSSGFVHLSASQSGGNVLIRITDDGAGLNKDALKAKAIANGLINENADLSESEIYSLIFAPGFSTAKKVTNVSGRGVGMDVVKRAIDVLRGTVEVSSELGIGTTITLKLPLTLAIIDGLLVKIEEDHYVLPLSSVEECLELTQEDIDKNHGRQIVNVRGSIVPYISLRERFRITSQRPNIEQIVVAKINEHRIGFVVDEVFGQHQTVLKSLGNFYKNVEGVSGATILGDGTVALILDIRKITEREELLEKEF